MLYSRALNYDLIAGSCAEKCRADGGGVGDLTAYGVGLVGAYDVIGELLCTLNVIKGYDRADANYALVDLRLVAHESYHHSY